MPSGLGRRILGVQSILQLFFFRAYYTRRKFRPIYAKVMNKTNSHITHRNSASFVKYYGGGNPLSLLTGMLPVTTEMALFDYPFNELLVKIIMIIDIALVLLIIYLFFL